MPCTYPKVGCRSCCKGRASRAGRYVCPWCDDTRCSIAADSTTSQIMTYYQAAAHSWLLRRSFTAKQRRLRIFINLVLGRMYNPLNPQTVNTRSVYNNLRATDKLVGPVLKDGPVRSDPSYLVTCWPKSSTAKLSDWSDYCSLRSDTRKPCCRSKMAAGRHPGFDRTGNSAMRSADSEDPT